MRAWRPWQQLHLWSFQRSQSQSRENAWDFLWGGTGEDQLMHHAARALKIETIVSYTKNVNSYAHFGINANSSKHEDI
jgi:hypothetical protein